MARSVSDPDCLRSILVLEDCEEDYDTLLEAFGKAGLPHKIHRTVTGNDCRNLLSGDSGLDPDIILLDLNTPGLDGREVLRDIKQNLKTCQIPVVILTTSSNPRDLAACYQSGANAYHVKPVRYPEHLSLLGLIFDYWLKHVITTGGAGAKA